METKTTIRLPADLLREARIRAVREGLSMSEVLRQLLRLWLRGEVGLGGAVEASERTRLARQAFGIWSDRDPDQYLADSRAGLTRRDREIEDARLGV